MSLNGVCVLNLVQNFSDAETFGNKNNVWRKQLLICQHRVSVTHAVHIAKIKCFVNNVICNEKHKV